MSGEISQWQLLYLTDSQKMCFYLQKRTSIPSQFWWATVDHSKVFWHMMAPACIYSKHQVDGAIENSAILYRKDLTKLRGESHQFILWWMIIFTLEEYVQTMQSFFKDPKQGYENLCKDYLNWKKNWYVAPLKQRLLSRKRKNVKKAEDILQSKFCCSWTSQT